MSFDMNRIQDNLTHVYSADRLYEACSVDSGRCGLVCTYVNVGSSYSTYCM